jgi:hypothetical protein
MQLIETTINTAKLGGILSIEVLTSLAEETVLRSKAHQWEVSCKDMLLRLIKSQVRCLKYCAELQAPSRAPSQSFKV